MADNVAVTAGSGTTVAADEVVDGTLGTVKVQFVKLMDGTLDGTTKAAVGANGLAADVKAVVPGTGATSLGKAEDAAHASADTGVMALAVRKDTAAALAGTDGDYAPLEVDASGRLHTAPAARTSDTISAAIATDVLMSNVTALTPKFAAIAAASSGDNTLVAAVASKQIRVLALMGVAAGAVSLYFTSGAGGTVIFGGSTNKIAVAANGGFVLPFNPLGWFQNSSVNQALVLNLSAAVAFSGGMLYVEV